MKNHEFMKILLVEPDEYYHSQFMTHVGEVGELVIASNANQAKKLIPKINPDAIVLELLLSDEPAYQLLEEMGKNGRRFTPTIIFSKINNIEDIEAAMNLGANGYFVKGRDTIQDVKKLLLTYKNDV